MTMTLSGSGTIAGLVAGGLPDATVTAPDLASGAARTNFGAGAVLQVVSATKTDHFTTTATLSSPATVTGLSVSITPLSTSNKILVLLCLTFGGSSTDCFARIVRNGNSIDNGTGGTTLNSSLMGNGNTPLLYRPEAGTVCYLDSPATTSALTYGVEVYSQNGASQTIRINGRGNDNAFGTVSSITVMEIAA